MIWPSPQDGIRMVAIIESFSIPWQRSITRREDFF